MRQRDSRKGMGHPLKQPPHQSNLTNDWMEQVRKERDDAKALLRWIAYLIQVRDGNGRRSSKMCLLCNRLPRTRIMKHGHPVTVHEPCRHEELWAFLNEE